MGGVKLILREVLKSKIQGATISKTELNYAGSIGIDKNLVRKADLVAGEKVQVLNLNNGERLETYVIEEKEDSHLISLYGPAARKGQVGDKIHILSYVLADEEGRNKLKPKVILVDENNKAVE